MNENNITDAFHKTETQKGLIMIASPIYHRKPFREKAAPMLLKYVSQGSLAVLLFVALAVLASVGNKSSEKGDPGLSSSLGISQSRDQQTYLSLDPQRLVAQVFASIKDAFNEPALIEYANEQGIDIPDSLTTPCPNISQSISIISKSPSNQSNKPSWSY